VLCDREPVKDGSNGRVMPLGDAAHPIRNICEAPAWLRKTQHGLPTRSLRTERSALCAARLRNARVQIMARVYGELYARGPAAELRNALLGPRTAEQSYEGISWLYGGM
jgi:3-hydroxybenzoate 6-monooxygenase